MTEAARPLAAFWNGFAAPSRLGLALTLAVFVLTLAAVCALVTPARIAGPFGAFVPRSAKDTEAFATREALRLSGGAGGTAPRLVVLGNSVLAHAVASEAGMAAALRAATGDRWQVSVLTTPLQGAVDEAALADHATARRPATVVVPVGFTRFAASAERLLALDAQARLGLRSAWADDRVRALGGRPRPVTGVYALDNSRFLLRNAGPALGRALAGRPAGRRIDIYVQNAMPAPALARQRARLVALLHGPGGGPGAALLAATVADLRVRGATVVLAEEPVSGALFETAADRARYATHLGRSAAFARQVGARYCRPADTARPAPEAFPDFIHVTDPATQARLRAALAACLATR